MPIKCPICEGMLLTEYVYCETYSKRCIKSTHHIIFVSSDEYVNFCRIHIENDIWFQWSIKQQCCYFMELHTIDKRQYVKNGSNLKYIPFFEPDFLNYQKLIEKIKTYSIFS